MRKIEAIIKPQALGAVMTALDAAMLGDVTISQVWGKGRHRGWKTVYRGAVYEIDTVAKLRIELIVPDDRVDEVLSLLCRAARTRGLGNGKVFVAAAWDTSPDQA
jgi:nitrogen regulatory protein P-II 1